MPRAGNFPVVGFPAELSLILRVRVPLQARRRIRSSPVPLLLRATPGGKGSSQPLASHKPRVQPNDIVEFDNQPGTWKVVAPVSGSKADVRRSGGFDTRIVTARLESLIVVRRAGSPGYSYRVCVREKLVSFRDRGNLVFLKSHRVFPEYHLILIEYAAVEAVDPFHSCTQPSRP